MKKYNKCFIGILFFFVSFSFLAAQGDFEGKVKFKITHDGDEMFLNYFIKGENMRMEMNENKEAVFVKNGKKSLILMIDQKMYMDLDNSLFSRIPGMNNNDVKEKSKNEKFDIDKFRTGKTKTILDFECAQWIIKDEEDEEEVEAWVTDELGNFMLMKSPMGAGFSPGWSSSIKNNGFFPILVITRDENGEESSRFEATEINKQSLSNDLFSAPSNFTEMKIPGL